MGHRVAGGTPRAINLGQLKGTFILEGPVDDCGPHWAAVTPTGVASDSRDVCPGDLFVAVPGERTHGAEHAPSAVLAGACAVLTDRSGLEVLGDVHVPVLWKEGTERLAGSIAAALWGQPSERLHTIAITGTHGVATTANMVHRMLRNSGIAAVDVGGERLTGPELHRGLATGSGGDAVVAIGARALRRGAATALRPAVVGVAALHDEQPQVLGAHVAQVRGLLAAARRRVILLDGDPAATLADEFPDAVLVALATSPHAHRATWRVTAVGADRAASSFTLTGPGIRMTTTVGRPGSLLLADAALAIVTLLTSGRVDVTAGIAAGVPVDIPGSMQVMGRSPAVVADRASSAHDLRRLLGALPRFGRIWCVYPADSRVERAGRLEVAQALSDGADEIVLAGSPGGEGALRALRACFTPSEAGRVHIAVSVDAAIAWARRSAGAGDIVVVAGCGTILRGQEPREGLS